LELEVCRINFIYLHVTLQALLLTRLIFILLFGFLISANAVSQKGYTVTHFTDDNGLPQNSVKSLAADSKGYLWLATENGLTRFDGQHFQIMDKSVLGTTSNRLYRMLPSMESSGKKSGKAGADSGLFASTDEDEYIRIENSKALYDSAYTYGRMKNLPFLNEGIRNTFVSVGLPTYLSDVVKPKHYLIPIGHGTGNVYVVDNTSVSFYEGQKMVYNVPMPGKSFWNYFTIGPSLYYMDANGAVSKVNRDHISKVTISGDMVRENNFGEQYDGISVYWNIAGDEVFLYHHEKLYAVKMEKDGRLQTRLILEDYDLEELNIQSIHVDPKNGNIFLGSLSDGLFVLTKHIFETLIHDDEDTDNVFYAQIAFGKNAILTPNGVILGKNPETGKTVSSSLPLIQKLNILDKRTLLRDKKGHVWITVFDMLYELDPDGKEVLNKWDLGDDLKHIFQDSKENIWVGLDKNGIYKLDLSNADPKPVLIQKDLKVTYFEESRDGRMLAGTINGLYQFEPKSAKYQLLAGTNGLYVKSLHIDDAGRIWLTVNREGLMLYNTGKIVRFPLDKNKFLGSPHCIVDDGRGYFWIPTDKGLFQMAIKDLLGYAKSPFSELFYLYHAKDEGLLTNEFNGGCQPCGVKLPNGYISLPSLKGLVWFKPEQVIANLPTGSISLDKIQINQKLVPTNCDTLRLPDDPAQAKFQFSTSYYGNPYNLNLSYALVEDGHAARPKDFIPIQGQDFTITFSNLNPGRHKLIVRKLNGFGVNNYATRTILVIVPPIWYQTWWVKALFFIGIVLLIYLYNHYRLKNISVENARLEEIVAKRTESLNLALSDVEESKTEMRRQIHMLSRILASMTHDIQSPLNYIMLTSGAIPAMVEKGDFGAVTEIGQVISNSSQRMSDLLRGLLDYIKVHVYGNSMHFEEINLKVLVESKFEIFESVIELNGNRFLNEIPDQLLVSSDYQMLAVMIHNLIDNATKFTKQGIIRVYSEMDENGCVQLLISNTGEGIPYEVIEVINAPESDELEGLMRPFGRKTGLGLLIVKEIAELIHIKLSVTLLPETCFVLRFPGR
jgi:signal transduction histidine kinase